MSELQLKFRPSIASNNLATQVANEELKKTDNFDTLKKSYLSLLHQLEIDGIPRNKIIHTGRRIIIEKKRIIKKQEGGSLDEIKDISIGSWYYEITKITDYHKSPQPDEKIVPLTKYEIENESYIKVLKNTKDFLDIAINKLKHNNFISLLDDDSKVILSLHDWQAHLDTANSYFDHKEKIPANTQHILLHCIGTISSNNDVAIEYFKLRAKAQHLTGKQISKYRSGQIKTTLEIFNPTGRTSAILWNYFGVSCTQCESWRVIKLSNKKSKVECLDCKNIFEGNSAIKCNYCAFPFFEDEISFIKKGNKCPNCKNELPDYLINSL